MICSEAHDLLAGLSGVLPFVEVGFPSYYTHALMPQPLLGYPGVACLVTRLVNALRQQPLLCPLPDPSLPRELTGEARQRDEPPRDDVISDEVPHARRDAPDHRHR